MATREEQGAPPPHEPDAHHVAMVMDAFGKLSDLIVAKTIAQYKSMRSHVDPTRWQPIRSERGIHLYQERSAMNTQRDGVEPAMTNSWSNRSNYHHRHRYTRDRRDRSTSFTRFATSRVNAMATGRLRGRLDTVMAGLYADTSEDMRWNCAVQHGEDSLVGCGIVRTMETATDAQPYRYVGIKWLERVCSRSFVTDQFFWLERMGLFRDPASGQTFGFQLLKSIDLDVHDRGASELPTRRVNVSLCYIYCQSAPDVVSVFTRGLVEIPTQIDQDEDEVVQVAAHYILASIRGKECRQMRQISKLLRQSSDDASCAYCQHTVDSPHNAELCTACHGITEQAIFSSYQHEGASSSHAEEEDDDAQDFMGMFRPIRDPRPGTAYRTTKQQQGNELMRVLSAQHKATRSSSASSAAAAAQVVSRKRKSSSSGLGGDSLLMRILLRIFSHKASQ